MSVRKPIKKKRDAKPKKVLPPYESYIIEPCLKKYGLLFGKELMFDEIRQWRFDFYCYDLMLAIEVEGIGGVKSRHTTTKGYIADMEKYNQAAVLGWTILRFTPSQIRDMSYQQTLTTWLLYYRDSSLAWHTRKQLGIKDFDFQGGNFLTDNLSVSTGR